METRLRRPFHHSALTGSHHFSAGVNVGQTSAASVAAFCLFCCLFVSCSEGSEAERKKFELFHRRHHEECGGVQHTVLFLRTFPPQAVCSSMDGPQRLGSKVKRQ